MGQYQTYTWPQILFKAARLCIVIPLAFWVSLAALVAKSLGYNAEARNKLAASLTDLVAQAVRQVGGRSKYVALPNGHTLHYVEAGPADGHPVLLLHGFPDSWALWKTTIPDLASAGYRVIAPDQVGAGFSSKPSDAREYTATAITADYLALVDTLKLEKFGLMGHDFGGVFAYRLAKVVPKRISGFLTVSTLPGEGFMKLIQALTWEQIFSSWYMLFFNIPVLPDALLGLHPVMTAKLFARATDQVFDDETITMLAAQLSVPGAVTSLLNVYRGFRYKSPKGTLPPTPAPGAGFKKGQIPVSGIFLSAKKDAFLPPAGMLVTKEVAPKVIVHTIDTGHWAPVTAGPALAAHMIGQLKKAM